MALAMQTRTRALAGTHTSIRCKQHCTIRPAAQQRVRSRSGRVEVAAVEPSTAAQPEQPYDAALEAAAGLTDPSDIEQQHTVAELDEAQENLLKWMLFLDGDQQEADLDEAVDLEEVGDGEFEALYDEVEGMLDESEASFKVGDKVYGTVYEVDEDGAYVEIGAKTAGFVPLAECSLGKLKTPLEVLRPGMKREFVVVEDEDEYGEIVLSLAAIEAQVFWQRVRQLQEEDVAVAVTVLAANRGGLLVQYAHLEGFIPASHLAGTTSPEAMEAMVGSTVAAKFLDVDEEAERLVLSHRRASSSAEMSGYRVGDVVLGVVQSVRPYGAFVDIGGAVGLLHISQITHERLTTVDEVLAEGDRLKVMILSQDVERGRFTLSTKKLEPEPGDMLRDPQKVFEAADRMAQAFRERVAAADAAALAYDSGYALPAGGAGGDAAGYGPPGAGVGGGDGGYYGGGGAPMAGAEQAAAFDA